MAAQALTHPLPRTKATHKFIRDILFSNLPVPFLKLRSYLWLIVFSRCLGPSGYGEWSLFTVSLAIGVALGTLNVGSSMMRFLSGERSSQEVDRTISTVFTIVIVTSTAVAALIVLFSRWGAVALFHHQGDRIPVVLLAAILPFECIFESVKGLLRARRLNRTWAILIISQIIPETLVSVAVGWIFKNIAAVLISYVTLGLLSALAAVFYLTHYQGIRLVAPSRAITRKYISFGVPLIPGGIAYFLSVSADRYIVGYYLDLKQVGIYSVCFTISALAFFLFGPINDVLFPELSTLYDAGDWPQFLQRFSGIQKFMFGFSVGAAALLSAFPRDVLRVLTPRTFAGGDGALAILGVQGIFMSLVLLYAVLLGVRLKVWSYSWFWLASGAAILLLDILLVPRMGIVGAAVSQLVATAAGASVLIGVNWRLFRETFPVAWLVQAAMTFAVAFIVAALWPQSGSGDWLHSCVRLAAGTIAIITTLHLLGFVHHSDVRTFRAALAK